MQSALCRIGTPVAVSISYDDNHYTTGTAEYTSDETVSRQKIVLPTSSEIATEAVARSVPTVIVHIVDIYF